MEQSNTQYYTFTPKELEFISLFWEVQKPMARAEIIETAERIGHSWQLNSAHILLNSLLEKGALRVAGLSQVSKRLGRTYEAAVTLREYRLMRAAHALNLAKEAGASPQELQGLLGPSVS